MPPLTTLLAQAPYRGIVHALRFPEPLTGLFGGVELDLYLNRWRPEGTEHRWVTVHCDGVFDYAMSPNYTLIEGLPQVELTRDDPLLAEQRLANLWDEDAEPRRDRSALSLLRCGQVYVIAERFTFTETRPDGR